MASLLVILLVLSLQSVINATKVTFVKSGDKIYVETSPENFAMFYRH